MGHGPEMYPCVENFAGNFTTAPGRSIIPCAMPSQKYKMVRIRTSTHVRLAALRDRLFAAYQNGKLALPDDQAEHLTFDYALNRLIDHFLAHDRRKAASRQKRAKGEEPVYSDPLPQAPNQ